MKWKSLYVLVALALISTLMFGCSGAKEQAAVDTEESQEKVSGTATKTVQKKVSRGYKKENGFQYMTAAELKEMLEKGEQAHLVDIQVEDDYAKGHIKGSIATYAYPVKSAEEQAKLERVMPKLKKDKDPVVIVCPRGGGGAERTYQYLKKRGISESRLFILEKGWEGWPYPELTAKGSS